MFIRFWHIAVMHCCCFCLSTHHLFCSCDSSNYCRTLVETFKLMSEKHHLKANCFTYIFPRETLKRIWHRCFFSSHSHLKCALILRWTASLFSSAELNLNLRRTCSPTTCTSTRRRSPSTCRSTNPAPPPHPSSPPPQTYHPPLSDPPSPRLRYRRHPPPPPHLPPLHQLSPQPHRCSRQAPWSPLAPG